MIMAATKKVDNAIKAVTIREDYLPGKEKAIERNEKLYTGNLSKKPIPHPSIKGGGKCECCPYGYHIDLDFVTYCEELYNGTYHHNLKRFYRDHRKQRKSPEIHMGIHNLMNSCNKTYDSPLLKSNMPECLQSCHEKCISCRPHLSHLEPYKSPILRLSTSEVPKAHSPLKIGISIDTTDAFLSNINISSSNQSDGYSPVSPFAVSRSRSGSNTSLSSTSTECSTNFNLSGNLAKCTCGSEQIADTMATLNAASVTNSGLPLGYVGINTNVLSTIRSQVATSLNRMKELEEQAKAIPILQVKLSVLKEEKRLLLLQLKNKGYNIDQKSIDIDGSSINGSDNYDLSQSATLPRYRKRTLSGTSLGRRGIPLYSSTGHLTSSLDEPLEKNKVINLKDFRSCQRIYDDINKLVNKESDKSAKVRSVGTSCSVLTRDIGVGHIAERLKSVGIGDEDVSENTTLTSTPNKCTKCGRVYIESDIPLDSFSDFVGSESDSEIVNFSSNRLKSTKLQSTFKTIKVEEKATNTDSITSKLISKTFEGVSIPSINQPCSKCEEKAKIKYRNTGIEAKIITKSSGVNTDSVKLKNIGIRTDPHFNSASIGSNTDVISSNSSVVETDLSMSEIETLQLYQLKQKQMKDKGTGIPRPLMSNVKVQATPSMKDSFSLISTENQHIGIQVNISSKNEDLKIKENNQNQKMIEQEILNKAIQATFRNATLDASCGNCSIHDTFCNRCELRQMETIGVGNDVVSNVICDHCQDKKYSDIAVGEEKPVVCSVGINTTEILNLDKSNSGIHVCDKCNAKIKSVAKDLVDKNKDSTLQTTFPHKLIMPQNENKNTVTTSVIRTNVESSEKKDISSTITKHHSAHSKEKLQIKQETLTKITKSKSKLSQQDESTSEMTDTSESPSSESPDERAYNGILGKIINRHKNKQAESENMIFGTLETLPRKKVKPSAEMILACKMFNESLSGAQIKPDDLASGMEIVQKEWFHISSEKDSDPHAVEDYLDAFEELSKYLLHRIVNLTDANGNTAMHYSVSHGNFDVVSVLLDSKVCDANIKNKAGYTAVMLISLAEINNEAHKQVVKRLFQINDINLKAPQNSQTALMLAASQGRTDAVQLLLECGAEINMQDKDGSTALMCAAEHGHIDVVHQLLANPDCDPLLTDNDGSTALSIAMEAGNRDVALMIYANVHFSRGNSPYSSLRTRRNRTASSSRSSLPPKGSVGTPPCTPPLPSPRERKNSSTF